MADRMEEDVEEVPAEEDDMDSDREEEDGLFDWIVHEEMDEEEEEEVEVEEEDNEQPIDTESSESFELDMPAERSGHIAVVDRNVMYVWGGYKVSSNIQPAMLILFYLQIIINLTVNSFPPIVRMLKTTDSSTCICREMKSGHTTWSQASGESGFQLLNIK